MAESALDRHTAAAHSDHKASSRPSSRYERTNHERPRERRRSRSRSRSRDARDRKRKLGGGYEREREREEPRSKRHTSEARSRSPRRDRQRVRERGHEERERGAARQKSPPRGPRGGAAKELERPRDRDRDHGSRQSTRTNGASAASVDSRPKNGALRDTQMGNGEIDPDEDDEAAMQRIMGFGAFRTTKNTKVPGNSRNYGVRKEKKTEYRQYMNRQGGFNRPLSPGR